MDRHFLEFRGNLLIQAAKGQKQLEELTRLVNQGVIGVNFYVFGALGGLTCASPSKTFVPS